MAKKKKFSERKRVRELKAFFQGLEMANRHKATDQLEYEGFSQTDATSAAHNCGADWNEQAAKKAKEYLSYSSFSHDSLIEQLEYEGFTSSQAAYGCHHAY